MTERKKSVLIVSQLFPPESGHGNVSRIYDMAYNLTKQGVDVHVISPFPTFPNGTFSRTWKLSSESLIDGINLTNLWTWQPLSKDPGFFSRMGYYLLFPLHTSLWVLFHGKKYDTIITSSPPVFTHIPGLLAKKFTGKKWIMDVRDLWIDASISLGFLRKGSSLEKITRIFEKKCLFASDAIGVTTHELGRRLSDVPEVQKKIHLIPNGVDTDYFHPYALVKKDQIVYAGNIGYAQDLDLVIRAVQIINQQRHLEFIIAGGGDTKSNLELLVGSLGLENIVHFPGILSREEIPRLFSESLLGVAPLKKIHTLEYAAPTKVYEYMSCCIPFVGCGAGEIQEIADQSGAGVIAENSPEAIAEAILQLVNDPLKSNNMGKSGRKFVEQRYTRKAITGTLNELIERIS
jgi:glycosyltransferase involved in cell wall biosynthesis